MDSSLLYKIYGVFYFKSKLELNLEKVELESCSKISDFLFALKVKF